MQNKKFIVKSTGLKEVFDKTKLENSLKNSGADIETITKIINEVMPWIYEGLTTNELYKKAYSLLKKNKRGNAARYSLKSAIMELGPSGFPFEQFIGQLLKLQGFEVEVGQIIQGQCIQHEVDVVATSSNKQFLIECKYYNTPGKFASVQVPLYVHSRMNDIIKKRSALPEYKDLYFYGWIVTNTRFTSDAEDYGKCSGMHLLSWDYPKGHSLKDMIEKNNFFPITVLTSLDKLFKNELIKNGIVVCNQIKNNPTILNNFGINDSKIKNIMSEINEIFSVE